MSKLNKDVLFLIFQEFQGFKKTLHSCLLVNKAWCEIIVPILWKNPWIYLEWRDYKPIFNVIISHLSNETKENLRIQGFNLPEIQQKPLFNYISFCKYLKLYDLERIFTSNHIEMSKIPIVINEILKLFVNRNTRITHIYIQSLYDYQLHLIPGAEYCFSELKFLRCHVDANKNNLEGLASINKSIEKLSINIYPYNIFSPGIVKLIEAQKNLNEVHFTENVTTTVFCKSLEESLIKHAGTVKYLRINWTPTTKVLSYLVNLISLEINGSKTAVCKNLENVSLPVLKVLKITQIPSQSLAKLIGNTGGHLSEISMECSNVDNNEHIKAIYQNCPNLKYLKLSLQNSDNVSELEGLLINCQHLDGLVIEARLVEADWNSLFKILTKSSPDSLFKFKFYFPYNSYLTLNSIKLFFDNWKGRHPMLLQTYHGVMHVSYEIKKYMVDGIVKKYDELQNRYCFEDFEWIQKKPPEFLKN